MFSLPFWQRNKKRTIFLLGLIVLAIIFIPLQFAKAGFWSQALMALPSLLVSTLLQIILAISEFAISFGNWFLQKAAQGLFNVSLTNPANNEVISIGWTLLRDMTNIMFIVGLAYIGLSTALNLTSFNTQKTFAKLLVVALFINFSPVICGAIVDVANILASFFLQSIDFSTIADLFKTQRSLLWENKLDIIGSGSMLLQVLMLIFFGVASAGILILFGALFFVRAPALWILVILSPIMFFFWVFDRWKKYFDMWWSQFLQWAFIVVPASFFIYLAQHAVLMSKTMLKNESLGQEPTAGVFNNIAPFFAAIIFLIFGLIMALKINAMGTGGIMGAAKNVSSRAKGYAKKAAKAPVKYAAAGAAAGALAAGVGARNLWKRKAGTALKPGQEGYEDWARGHQFRAKTGKAGRFLFGGETDKEKAEWSTGGKRVARTLGRGLLNISTLGGAQLAAGLGRRAARTLDAKAQVRTESKIKERAGKIGETPEELIAAIKNAGPGMLGDKQRIAALVKAIQGGSLGDIRSQLPDYLLKDIMKTAINMGAADSVGVVKTADPKLYEAVLREMQKNPDQSAGKSPGEIAQIKTEVAAEKTEVENLRNQMKAAEAILNNPLSQFKYYRDSDEYQKAQQDKETLNTQIAEKEQSISQKEKGAIKDMEIGELNITEQQQKRLGIYYSEDDKETYGGMTRVQKDANGNEETVIASTAYSKEVGTMSPSKMANLSKEAGLEAAQSEAAQRFWTGAQIAKGAELFGRKFIEVFQSAMPKMAGSTDPRRISEWYEKNNRQLYNYMNNSPARNLGLSWEGASTKTERQLTRAIERWEKRLLEINQNLNTGHLSKKEKERLETEKAEAEKKLAKAKADLEIKRSQPQATRQTTGQQQTQQQPQQPAERRGTEFTEDDIRDMNIVFNMNVNQVNDIINNGTDEQKEAIKRTYSDNVNAFIEQIERLNNTGDPDSAERLANVVEAIEAALRRA
ncbi:MAG: hypothetical protein PHN39_00460 [Candidatus Pacebacteria bacterium]|nr:hypothetical protein [Candidatus Paceibacterota bacterium]